MKLVSIILLTLLVLNIDAQRTRQQPNTESDENSSQQRSRTRGRVKFALPIDVDEELASIPSRAIRPDDKPSVIRKPNIPHSIPSIRAGPSLSPSLPSSAYEVQEILDDIPNKNVRKIHKSRIITETRFEAANAPKKPLYEPLPAPQDEILPEDILATFTPQISKATTERTGDTEKEVIEERLQNKEIKSVKNNLKQESVKEERITLSEETLTLSTEDHSDDGISSSQVPEVTTSSEQVSSTENEVKKHEFVPSTTTAADIKKTRTSRTRTASTAETSTPSKVSRTRGRRPGQTVSSTETTSANQRSRSRTRPVSSEASSEIPARATRVRTARRRLESSEDRRGPSVFSEEPHDVPKSRTGRKVTYTPADNEPVQDSAYTVRPRRGPNKEKSQHPEATTPENFDTPRNVRGRSNFKSRTQSAEAADVKRRNSPRGRSLEENSPSSIENVPASLERSAPRSDHRRNRKIESRSEEIKSRSKSETSSTTTQSTASLPSAEKTPRRNIPRRQFSSRSDVTASTEAQADLRRRNNKKPDALKESLNKSEKSLESSTERKVLFKARQRSRFVPPIIDEQKLEVLPLFESEAKTVAPTIKRPRRPNNRETMAAAGSHDHEIKTHSSNEIQTGFKPRSEERKVEVRTSKPVIKESVETKVSEVVSTRRVVRPIVRKIKNKGKAPVEKNKQESAKTATSRGNKKAELTKTLAGSVEEVDDSDNYPEAFKAIIKAKEGKKGSRPSSEDTIFKNDEKVVTAVRTTSTTTTTSTNAPSTESIQPVAVKIYEEDNNILPSSTSQPSRGTRRRFSLTTKHPNNQDEPATPRNPKRYKKTKVIRSTVSPSHISVVTEVSQTVRKQPRYHARFTASSTTTEGNIEVPEKEVVTTTARTSNHTPKTPRGLYSSRKGTGKKRTGKIDDQQLQQLPPGGKKQNRYSARYRSDLFSRSGSTRSTTAPAYTPTVPMVTRGYVKQGIEDGKEIITIDEPVNTIPSDSLINGELLTPSNIPAKLLPASLVTTGSSTPAPSAEKQPVSIIERIIYSITAISSTVAPEKLPDRTLDGPTKASAIFKIPNKKDDTDATNEIQTVTTEKPTTIIERILTSISAIQASTQSPKVGISTISSTVSTPSSTTIDTLGVIEDLSDEQRDQQRTISKLLDLLKSISPTPRNDLVVVTPKTTFATSTIPSTLNPDVEIFNVGGNSLESEPLSTLPSSTELPKTTVLETQTTMSLQQSTTQTPEIALGNSDNSFSTTGSQSIEAATDQNQPSETTVSAFSITDPPSAETATNQIQNNPSDMTTASILSNTIDTSNTTVANTVDSTISTPTTQNSKFAFDTINPTTSLPTTRFDELAKVLSGRFTEAISISDFLATLDSLNTINPTSVASLVEAITKVPMSAGRVQPETTEPIKIIEATTQTTEVNSGPTESGPVNLESTSQSVESTTEVTTPKVTDGVDNNINSDPQMIQATITNSESTPEMTESTPQMSDSTPPNSDDSSTMAVTISEMPSTSDTPTTEMNSEVLNSSSTDSMTTQNSSQTDVTETTTQIATKQAASTTMSSTTILELIARLLESTGTTPNTIASTFTVEKTTIRPSTDSGLSTLANFEVSPGSVTVFSANDVTSMFNPSDDNTTVTILSRTYSSLANQVSNSTSKEMNVTMSNEPMNETLSMSSDLADNTTNSMDSNISSNSSSVSVGNNTNMTSERSGRLLSIDPVPLQNDIETTTVPAKDYFIFAILPNNTIVRKKPSMYPNQKTPFIIVGVYPNNTIVQKFPNGTLIPEEPVIQTPARDLPTTPANVETTTNQPPPPTMPNMITESEVNQAQNSSLEILEPVQANVTNTEEVNIEENTISNNGNNRPEKIQQLPTVGTSEGTPVVLTTERVMTTMGRNNEDTKSTTENQFESLEDFSTIIPDINSIEGQLEVINGRGRQFPTQRYTNTPTTVIPPFENIHLTIRPTTPYLIQRILGNVTTVGARFGGESGNLVSGTTPVVMTTPEFVMSTRIRTTTLPTTTTETKTSTTEASTTTTQRTTTQPITTQPPTTRRTTTQPTTTEQATTTTQRITTTTQRITTTISATTTTDLPTTQPPSTTTQTTTTLRRRGGARFRTTTPFDSLVRTVTVTPSTVLTEEPETEQPTTMFPKRRYTVTPTTVTQPTKIATFSPTTNPTDQPFFRQTTTFESPTVFPVYTSNPFFGETTIENSTPSLRTSRPITKTPTTLPPDVLSTLEELQRLAEVRVQENFGELSTTNDFVKSTTPNPTTLQTTLKSVNAKVRKLTEQQKKDFEELAKLEKEQAAILQQLAFLTRLNLGGATPKPTRSPSNLANRVLEFAAERDQKVTTPNSLDILSGLTGGKTPSGTKEVSLDQLLQQLQPNPKREKATTQDPLELLSGLTNTNDAKFKTGNKEVSLDELLKQLNVDPELVTKSSLTSTYGQSTDAILAALLKEQGIGPSTPTALSDQFKTTTPVTSTTQRRTTRRKSVTTTTPRPGPIMQGLNWLLNMWAPAPSTTRRPTPRKKKVTTTPRPTTIAEDVDVFSSQPTEITPVVVTAPRSRGGRGGSKFKRPLHALSEDELSSLISQLEDAQKDPRKAKDIDLSAFNINQSTQKSTTLISDNAVQITNSGKVGSSSKLQVASSSDSEVIYSRKSTTPIPASVSNNIFEEEAVTKPPRRTTLPPVRLNPIPGIDNEGEPQVRGQLLSAAVNVTRAISQFLGSAIQGAAQSFQSFIGSGSRQVGNYFASSSSSNG